MAKRLLRAQSVSVANHVKARRSVIERTVTRTENFLFKSVYHIDIDIDINVIGYWV